MGEKYLHVLQKKKRVMKSRKPLKDKQDIIRKILIKTLSELSYIYRLTWMKISRCLMLVIWKRKKKYIFGLKESFSPVAPQDLYPSKFFPDNSYFKTLIQK